MPPDDQSEADEAPFLGDLNPVNAGYVAHLYEQFREAPASVDARWRSLFESGEMPAEAAAPPSVPSGNGQTDAAQAVAPRPTEAPTAAQPPPEGATPIKGPAARLAQ